MIPIRNITKKLFQFIGMNIYLNILQVEYQKQKIYLNLHPNLKIKGTFEA